MLNLRRLTRFLAATLLLVAATRAFAADVYVISNGVGAMSLEQVKEVFLGEAAFAGTLKLQPVDNAGAQADFLANVLKMSGTKYSAAWMKKAFRDGLNAPPLKATDAEVVNFVKSNPGAIGYVTSAPHGVHVVGKF
jgi:ABC-type phosphate transport system substrate-binding protein